MAALLKLGYFVVEKAAVPLAFVIRGAAENNELFRSGCIRMARVVGARERVRQGMWRWDAQRRVGPEVEMEVPTSERRAVAAGVEMLSEGTVLFAGLGFASRLWQIEADKERALQVERVAWRHRTEQALQAILAAQQREQSRLQAAAQRVHAKRERNLHAGAVLITSAVGLIGAIATSNL